MVMTDRRTTLLSLAERCEREGASYALDVEIAQTMERTAWAMGRDLDPAYWPKKWRPLPPPPTER